MQSLHTIDLLSSLEEPNNKSHTPQRKHKAILIVAMKAFVLYPLADIPATKKRAEWKRDK